MDARLAELDRLETLTRVAASAAHDFNNLITIIAMNANSLKATTREGAREEIEEIGMAVERAALLSRELLVSSRRRTARVMAIAAAEVARSFEPLLARIAGPSVELTIVADSALPLINMDPLELEHLLMNLVVNARDAMPKGGRITIACEETVFDAVYVAENPGARPGRHVVIAVTDTGTGMSPEVRQRVFEPFFTTKGAGQGTGLGLAIVQEVAVRNGGHVTLTSTRGVGSQFRVCFPAGTSSD